MSLEEQSEGHENEVLRSGCIPRCFGGLRYRLPVTRVLQTHLVSQ